MKNMALILFCIFSISSCKPKVKSGSDKKYELYSQYDEIFRTYGRVPLDSTEAKLNVLLAAFPEDARAWSFYARIMYDKGNYTQAIDAYRKTITYNPRFTMGYAGLGSLYNQLDQNDSALYYLEKAVELKDSSAYTFLNLSMLNLKTNNKERALAFIDSTIFTGDSSAAVYAGLSFVQHKLGNKAESDLLLQIAKENGLTDTASFDDVLAGKIRIDSFYKKNGY